MSTQTGLNRDYSFLVAAFPAIWRHARNSGAELAEGPQMAPPSCRRWEREGRSHHNCRREPARSVGSHPLSGRFGDRKPNPLTSPGAEGAKAIRANARVQPMSALGQKQTLIAPVVYVRFRG